MRELNNDRHVSPEANVSRFPFILFNLSGFSTLLVTTSLLRGYLLKISTMALQRYKIPKQYRALLELHITQSQLESPGRKHAAQLTIWNKSLCYFTTTRKQCVPAFAKDDRNIFFLTND